MEKKYLRASQNRQRTYQRRRSLKDNGGSEISFGPLLQNNKKSLQKREDLFLEFFDVISKTKTDYGKTS